MLSKNNFKKAALLIAVAAAFTACKKDNQQPEEEPTNVVKEFKYVRLLTSDETSNKLTLVDPFSSAISSFDAKYPVANLYATSSGRYAAVLYGTQNLAEVFDSGLSSHVDHIDVLHNPKWASITANGIKPTHFKSKANESLIFNDGDGTLSRAMESDFNTEGARFSIVNAGLLPHHGAMAQFTNGTYAVTSTTAAGASPNRVLIIGKGGKTVFASTLALGAIHGNATDGTHAVFGGFTNAAATAGGVLVVKSNGEQRLIPNPDGFGAFRLGSIYYAESAKKFIGYVATKGAYLIDLAGDKITPIYSGADAFQCKVDYAGKNLLVLTLDGKLRVYDLATGALKKEGAVISATLSTDTYKPVLEATAKFAYIALPGSGEVHQIDLDTFSVSAKYKVSSKPVRLTIFGFESNASH
ncbi:hypothetical protein OQZ33_17665 [Pedobacter sp. MC2016-05]|uniref:hypothetical protein n=1 Tax=Pedobacter sp. MC2016-05 TaxID=2994474 RepID=UPI002245FCC9|nr:hypothetical protein [Pedobacter sp. MC2016-05]MCX2476165.1 hypothetical protein [Pedobacter sp. MC2016-05]